MTSPPNPTPGDSHVHTPAMSLCLHAKPNPAWDSLELWVLTVDVHDDAGAQDVRCNGRRPGSVQVFHRDYSEPWLAPQRSIFECCGLCPGTPGFCRVVRGHWLRPAHVRPTPAHASCPGWRHQAGGDELDHRRGPHGQHTLCMFRTDPEQYRLMRTPFDAHPGRDTDGINMTVSDTRPGGASVPFLGELRKLPSARVPDSVLGEDGVPPGHTRTPT